MEYNKTTWTEETLIDVPKLQNIEDGIEGSYIELTAIQTDINNLQNSVSRRPQSFQGAFLSSSDSSSATLKTSLTGQEGTKAGAKIYTEIIDITFNDTTGTLGEDRNFRQHTHSIKQPDIVSIKEINGVFINSFAREFRANVVAWSSVQAEVTTLEIRVQNTSTVTMPAGTYRFNIMIVGY